MVVGRTAGYLDLAGASTYVRQDDAEGTRALVTPLDSMFGSDPAAHFERHPSAIISQKRWPDRHMHDSVHLIRRVGSGAYGEAFTCTIQAPPGRGGPHGGEYVIKLAIETRRADIRIEHDTDLQQADQKATPGNMRAADASQHPGRADTLRRFRREMANAEALLEPEFASDLRYGVALHDYRKRSHAGDPPSDIEKFKLELVGTRLHNLSGSQYFKLVEEVHSMRMHAGYHHMHQVLHFDPDLPAIISEKASGDLNSIRHLSNNRDPTHTGWLALGSASTARRRPPPLWIRIAAQLALAFDYMDQYCSMVHLDVKPGNVLFLLEPTSSASTTAAAAAAAPVQIRCMLSDYGICAPKTEAFDRTHFPGTDQYNPPATPDLELWNGAAGAARGDMQQLSAFQFAMTLLNLLQIQGHFASAIAVREATTIAEVFRHPPAHCDLFELHRHHMDELPSDALPEQKALKALLRIACRGDKYSPSEVLEQFRHFCLHIGGAAERLNRGIPYYTTEVRARNDHNFVVAEAAMERYEAAMVREEQLHQDWHSSRPLPV
jgi:hypothetical protein